MLKRPKPRRGAGYRNMDCPEYDNCLSLAAKKDWKTFNCKACTYQVTGQNKEMVEIEDKENARLCEDCRKKPTISPKHKLCASCMAKRSHRAASAKKATIKGPEGAPGKKRATENPAETPKPKKATEDIRKPDRADLGSDSALVVDFGKYASVLRDVKKLAEKEMRPIDLQVVYILKHYLSDKQQDRPTV